jgi:hypothetical protein
MPFLVSPDALDTLSRITTQCPTTTVVIEVCSSSHFMAQKVKQPRAFSNANITIILAHPFVKTNKTTSSMQKLSAKPQRGHQCGLCSLEQISAGNVSSASRP